MTNDTICKDTLEAMERMIEEMEKDGVEMLKKLNGKERRAFNDLIDKSEKFNWLAEKLIEVVTREEGY